MGNKPRVSKYIIPIIVVSLFEVCFEFIMENGTSDIYDAINKRIPYTFRVLMIIIIFSLVGILLYKAITAYYEKEIKDRDNKLKEKAIQIWDKYNDLHKYKTNEVIINVIHKFVLQEKFVLSVQLYEYSIKYINENVEFKINYSYGYVNENIDINSIMQAYYKINTSIFNEFLKAFDSEDNNKILQFALKYIRILNNKPLDKLNEKDSFLHELILLSIQHITENIDVDSILLEPSKEKKLVEMKRNGIVRGILNKDFYYFRNLRDNSKRNRIYITRTILLNNIPHIALMSIEPSLLSFYDNYELIEVLVKKGEKFLNLLQKDVDIEYN